jgi:serine protease SohB
MEQIGAWSQIGVFSAKAGLIVFALALVIILIAVLAAKSAEKPELEITPLHEKFQDYGIWLKSMILEKEELKAEKKKMKEEEKEETHKKRAFLIEFEGDVHASATDNLREEVTAILTAAGPEDEVIVKVESPGGVVHGYGLAASQLLRVREQNIPLTICIDKVAASGGYLMSCVGSKVIAAPFAIVGSIGVVAQVPNFHRLLKKNDVDYQEYTAGEFKRTVSIFGEITAKGEEKFKEQLEATHLLFKGFVSKYRPQLDLAKIATGEYWYGQQALDLHLVDSISTSDDYLMKLSKTHKIFKVTYQKHETLQDKISKALGQAVVKAFDKILQKIEMQKWV